MKLAAKISCKHYFKQFFSHFVRLIMFHKRYCFVYFLAIIQLIVAALTFSVGIAVVSHGENADNAMKIGIVGIFGGIIICVAGALGIISYKDHNNQNKNAFHMAFSIIGCCVSIVGIYFDTAELM